MRTSWSRRGKLVSLSGDERRTPSQKPAQQGRTASQAQAEPHDNATAFKLFMVQCFRLQPPKFLYVSAFPCVPCNLCERHLFSLQPEHRSNPVWSTSVRQLKILSGYWYSCCYEFTFFAVFAFFAVDSHLSQTPCRVNGYIRFLALHVTTAPAS